MFDHVSLQVRDFRKSLAFYRAALAPLGFELRDIDESGKTAGFGTSSRTSLWIAEGRSTSSVHLAFESPSRARVAEFHAAALRAGGKDNGGPDTRVDYAKDYFAAFVLDPDGNNVEAVTHEASKPVYYIGCYDIDDAERFQSYPPVVASLLPKWGGETLASDTHAHVLEGKARTMNAIIRFPSKEAALGLYGDAAYQEAKHVRQTSTSNVTMVLVEKLARR